MIYFFGDPEAKVYAVQSNLPISGEESAMLRWLFGESPTINELPIVGPFKGPRKSMVTPWSTNATEITRNMGIQGIVRIEAFERKDASDLGLDPMLHEEYFVLDQEVFKLEGTPDPLRFIEDISEFNAQEGLALSEDEIAFLNEVAQRQGRRLTDSEVFGFSQVNSEHCRHKIFNGSFVIDGMVKEESLFQLIKKTTRQNPNRVVSAYKDNVAFFSGPEIVQFAPVRPDLPSQYQERLVQSVLSLKAETHNFPTTVEPFNGAATGTGGEIRDRLAGGRGSQPLAGTAIYMTAYPRTDGGRNWEKPIPSRSWLYQTPLDILIKASNGASDFGNKYGQPLISGSLLTFEWMDRVGEDKGQILAYDKVVMLAGGVGYGKAEHAQKEVPSAGDSILVMGGDNYRIGMGGAAVSSENTGEFGTRIELNAVQRSNPEMQKRVANAIRGLIEAEDNPIKSIHDHGAGGHLNCLSELVEETGGEIQLDELPVGDPTLSQKEIIGNESQERMGLIVSGKQLSYVQRVAERERAPMFDVGRVTGDQHLCFKGKGEGPNPIDLPLSDFFGSSPQTIMNDTTVSRQYRELEYDDASFEAYLKDVLQLEAVACKDWLTNKVDRCVGGRVAVQQTTGPLQLPLNNCGVVALDYTGRTGVASSIGHAPVAALIDPEAGSRLSVAEALTNLVWAPLDGGLETVSLSANWMWPCRNPGEDARLYSAVRALSEFALDLKVNIPTGKDSLSMKQRYSDREVLSPGTVIISAAGACDNIRKVVSPTLKDADGPLVYIPFSDLRFELGGSSFAQVVGQLGNRVPETASASEIRATFGFVQDLIRRDEVLSGHDVGSGGLITTLLELCFPSNELGMDVNLDQLGEADSIRILFAENPALVLQLRNHSTLEKFKLHGIPCFPIGTARKGGTATLLNRGDRYDLDIAAYRDIWYRSSYLLDREQTEVNLAQKRYENYKKQPLEFNFPGRYGKGVTREHRGRVKAAVLREKGSNSEREMANALYQAGFEVRDVHMTDLVSGREDLSDIRFIGAVGGFSNSDVLGSAKGWAGVFKYNPKARKALMDFFAREDTLSLGICNGCQLFMELGLIYPEHENHGTLTYNGSGKHECNFVSVEVHESPSIMLKGLEGSRLGVWISHGEGRFSLPEEKEAYSIAGTYAYEEYPGNPNGSDFSAAMLCDRSGRHLVSMPHMERSLYPWNWPYYTGDSEEQYSPWIEAFRNAYNWLDVNK